MSARIGLASRSSALAARRRRNRRRALIALLALLILATGAGIYLLQQPTARIKNIEVYVSDALASREVAIREAAERSIAGSYLGLIPRDSTFFLPAERIRRDILADNPDAAAVSIFKNGLDKLVIKVSERAAVARWCGDVRGEESPCYLFDASGVIYAAAASTSPAINPFILYGALEEGSGIGATVAHATLLPTIFDFARQIATFGSTVREIVIKGDEVSNMLASGTRVTYVLGHEHAAFAALSSAKSTLSLADGSLEYVDLRFDGKVYLKRKLESEEQF
jgi:cell division septal protein FtsQ